VGLLPATGQPPPKTTAPTDEESGSSSSSVSSNEALSQVNNLSDPRRADELKYSAGSQYARYDGEGNKDQDESVFERIGAPIILREMREVVQSE
jgi:hypothetical protein